MTALLALFAALCLGLADFLGGVFSRRIAQVSVLVVSQTVAVIAFVPQMLWTPVGDDPAPALIWGVVSGVGAAVGVAALYRALAIGTMGVVAPIAALSVLVPVIAGLLDGDRPSLVLAVAMALAILGSLLASGPEVRRGGNHGRSIALAMLAAAGFGVNNLAIARGSAYDVTATLAANVGATLLLYVAAAAALRTVPRVRGRALWGVGAIGALGFLANLSFAVASQSGMLSVVAVCASVFPAVTVLLGWWVLKERLSTLQLSGVGLVLGGVVLIALSA